LLIFLILGFACASLYVSVTSPPSLAEALIFGLISVAGTLAFPPEIFITDAGVTEVKWWAATTAIPWKDVVGIEFHKGSATTVIVSKGGSQVVHSGWNRDTKGFLQIL
jgi:hypothetical protein